MRQYNDHAPDDKDSLRLGPAAKQLAYLFHTHRCDVVFIDRHELVTHTKLASQQAARLHVCNSDAAIRETVQRNAEFPWCRCDHHVLQASTRVRWWARRLRFQHGWWGHGTTIMAELRGRLRIPDVAALLQRSEDV